MTHPKNATAVEVVGGQAPRLAGAPAAAEPRRGGRSLPAAAAAARLIEPVGAAGEASLLYVAGSEAAADEVAHAFKNLSPETEVIVLPPWDCLPYDSAMPSRECMGRRATAIEALSRPARNNRLVVTSVEAALGKVPTANALSPGFKTLSTGDAIDREALLADLERAGYILDERIDEAGEAAFLGQVLDVFPSAADLPVRVLLDEQDRITDIRTYDPLSQRTVGDLSSVRLPPASELIADEAEETVSSVRTSIEVRLLRAGVELRSVFDLLPTAARVTAANLDDRLATASDLIVEARQAREEVDGAKAHEEHFYLREEDVAKILSGRGAATLDVDGIESLPDFLLQADPADAAAKFLSASLEKGSVLLAGTASELARMERRLARRLKRKPTPVEHWQEVMAAKAGSLLAAPWDLEHGYVEHRVGVVVLAAPDLFGARLHHDRRAAQIDLSGEPELAVGDVVIHEDHGVCVLRALESIEVDGVRRDTVRLEFHGAATLLAPVEEFGRIWRYGADEGTVTLDRLKGEAWNGRKALVSAEIDEAARQLVELAREREAGNADKIVPPRAAYARFSARFPYPETPDQQTAIASVLEDLASGKAMNRLVCGDVGFGKTEVALRAAAAVALSGKQVAVVAPTTVLARQHYETFRRRFAGTGVQVGHLSRAVGTAETKRVQEGLASGEIGVVVGTHAVAGKNVSFKDLGLVVIDEEHRFGTKLKESLRSLKLHLHVLTLSATPIPRTLQGAMVGIHETSTLATPPARRRPVRTALAEFDPAAVRTALLREKRRNGQSFFVVPRIEDIDGIRKELGRIVPELSLRVAHGELEIAELDQTMVGFADGEGDVLLATNIIESGLDVPRANTIMVWRPDRFGLAQLHQIRGRVGRGRAQGFAYLLTEPGQDLAEETRSRLSTLVAFDRLGSGLAISARDLDLRGAGDLVGDDQAGHMKLIGVSLYQRLLARAVRAARGEPVDAEVAPRIELEMAGVLPEDYVSEPVVRLNLYSRLQRLEYPEEISSFEDELTDRFGPLPDEVRTLLEVTLIKLLAAQAGVSAVRAGPKAIAVEFIRQPAERVWARLERRRGLLRREDRLVAETSTRPGPKRLDRTRRLLEVIADAVR